MTTSITVGVLATWQVYEGTTIDGYLQTLLEGIRAAAHAYACNLLLSCGVAPPIPRRLLTPAWPVPMPDAQFVPVGPWNTNGLIVVPSVLTAERLDYIRTLIAGGYPVVFAGAPELRPTVVVDNAGGIDMAVDHLAAHGRRRIVFLARRLDQTGDSLERLQTYQAALRRLGLDVGPDLVAQSDQADDVECGRQAMQSLLARGIAFSGVLAFNDLVAVGAMQVLKDAGLSVPGDVAVIGFDDRIYARVQSPPLTTVRHPTFDLGYQSLVALLRLLDGTWDGSQPIRIPTHLVLRQSCGCRTGAILPAPAESSVSFSSVTGRQSLAKNMAETAAAEARHLSFTELAEMGEELVAALAASLGQADPAPFNQALAIILKQTEDRNEDIYIWHVPISLLQNEINPPSGPEDHPTMPAQHLLDQAHLAVSEGERRQETRALIQQREIADNLGLMTAQLLGVLDAGQISAILARYLPKLGIRHILVALFEPDEDDPASTSLLTLRCGLAGEPENPRFITHRFPAPGFYPSGENFYLAVLPLLMQGKTAGFMAFDASNLEHCAVIMHNVAAAMRNSQLFHDAAEGRRLAEEANRLKTRFLSTVSHELRTPLNVIVGLTKLMLHEQSQGANPAPQDLERIFASAQHLGFLIRDVLDLASSDAGQLRLSCEVLDLVQVMQGIVAIGGQMVRDKGLAWLVDMPEKALPVWGDPTRLRQVALNFISNAVKFTLHGSVTLAIQAGERQVSLSVRDTGLGIPVSDQQSIFDEFRQSERTTSRGFGGLGLGLAISRHLIDLHGGDIGVHSSGVEGEGAVFYFTLPVMNKPALAFEPARLPLSQVALMLAYESAGAMQLSAYLRKEGFEVITQVLENQPDWLEQISQAAPAAILLDQRLASERAWEIVRQLKMDLATQDVPVLFFALDPESDAGSVLELNYRLKPLDSEQLARVLKPVTSAGQPPTTILVVEDDPYVLDLHTRLVRQQLPDCQVLQARDGRQALEVMDRSRPDLVLLDLMMPELDGFGVLEAMQTHETTRDIPVIVLTAQILNEADMARLNRGVVSVLEKGILSVEETLARVSASLARLERKGSAAQRLVRKAMAYLHECYAEPVSREQVANYVGASESYLASCFHQELGLSPMAYLNRYRIKQARTLLESGDMNVTEVAFAVGFSDSAYFGRVFQRDVGISPGAYRRGLRTH